MSTFPISPMEPEEREPRSEPAARSPFVPLLLFVIAFLAWTIFQTTQLIAERSALAQARSQQAAPLAQAQKVRAAADSLAKRTQELAEGGDVNAQSVIAQLRQRGITIHPEAPTVPTP